MASENRLDLSVLISTRDRAHELEITLEHLQRQKEVSGINWEILVVDNGSSDNTQSVLMRAQRHLPLVILYEPLPGKSRGLNKALEVARGDLLVFTDDDVEPSHEWLSQILTASRNWPGCSIFCGPIVPVYPADTPAWLQEVLRENPALESAGFGRYSLSQAEGPTSALPFGANFAVRASCLFNIHFDPKIGPHGRDYMPGEESDLLTRLFNKGERNIYVPTASVKHIIRKDQIKVQHLLRRAFQHGRGHARVTIKNSGNSVLPTRTWLALIFSASALYLRSLFRGKGRRFKAGVELYYLCGLFFEYHKRKDKSEDESLLTLRSDE
jgi:glycosyltransferase involved in cell wall biosynthesis